jgi:hypothetical protein
MIEQAIANRKILNHVIINCIYHADDKFFYATYLTRNNKILRNLFKKEYVLDDNDVVDCKTGNSFKVDMGILTNISIPDLPYEISPVFLFNDEFKDKVEDVDFCKIQYELITQIKRFLKTNKNKRVSHRYPLPYRQFMNSEKVKAACKLLRIDTDHLFSKKKNIVKFAKEKYLEQINSNFDIFLNELELEKKILNKRIEKDCKFSASALEELNNLEKTALTEREDFTNREYTVPIEMLLDWPSLLAPPPNFILKDTEYAGNIRAEIDTMTTESEVREYYNNAILDFQDWYAYDEVDNKTGKIQKILLSHKVIDNDILEIFTIPQYNVMPSPSSLFLNNVSIYTNAFAITNKIYKKVDGTENKYFVFTNKNNKDVSVDAEELIVVEKTKDDSFIADNYSFIKTSQDKLTSADALKVLNSFLVFG